MIKARRHNKRNAFSAWVVLGFALILLGSGLALIGVNSLYRDIQDTNKRAEASSRALADYQRITGEYRDALERADPQTAKSLEKKYGPKLKFR
jgi:hypothetical protein